MRTKVYYNRLRERFKKKKRFRETETCGESVNLQVGGLSVTCPVTTTQFCPAM